MSFNYLKGTTSDLDRISKLVSSDPRLNDQFEAIAEFRNNDDGMFQTPGFRRVASLIAPLHLLANVLEPEFMMNKRKFYRWLDANPEYCTYDRRAAMARSKQAFHGWTPEGETSGNLP